MDKKIFANVLKHKAIVVFRHDFWTGRPFSAYALEPISQRPIWFASFDSVRAANVAAHMMRDAGLTVRLCRKGQTYGLLA